VHAINNDIQKANNICSWHTSKVFCWPMVAIKKKWYTHKGNRHLMCIIFINFKLNLSMRNFLLTLILIFSINIISRSQTFTEILCRPTDTSMSVSVLFSQIVTLYVEYGTVSGVYPDVTSQITSVSGMPDVIDMQNLLADTKYYYRTRYSISGTVPFSFGPEHSFRNRFECLQP
jgi:hypothetical protein